MTAPHDSTTRVRAAVVGCGAISYEHLAYLGTSPLVQLVAVCDTSPAAGAFACERYGASKSFTDVGAMLEETAPQVLHVLTPPHTHAPLAALGLEAGCDIICEKPAATTVSELEGMIAAAQDRSRRLMESQNLRYNDEVQLIAGAVGRGDLGDVREVDVMLSLDFVASRFGDLNLSGPGVHLPGGAVHDFLPHLAYLFLMFTTSPVDSLSGRLLNASGNARVGFDQLDALVTAGATRGRLRVACDLEPSSFRLVVRGTRASMETDLYNPYLRTEGGKNVGKRVSLEHLASGARLALSGLTNLKDKVMQHGPYHGMPRMLDAFYRAVVAGGPQPISFDDMVATAELVDAIVALQVAT